MSNILYIFFRWEIECVDIAETERAPMSYSGYICCVPSLSGSLPINRFVRSLSALPWVGVCRGGSLPA